MCPPEGGARGASGYPKKGQFQELWPDLGLVLSDVHQRWGLWGDGPAHGWTSGLGAGPPSDSHVATQSDRISDKP